MGMSSVKQDMRIVWNVKNIAQNLLISPRSTWRGVNQQRTWNLSFLKWGGGRGEGFTKMSVNRPPPRFSMVGGGGGGLPR